jgi:hypothetical protein
MAHGQKSGPLSVSRAKPKYIHLVRPCVTCHLSVTSELEAAVYWQKEEVHTTQSIESIRIQDFSFKERKTCLCFLKQGFGFLI